MKKLFFGHYRPSQEEFSEIWDNCIFVLDANVLLNLYRYSPQTYEAWINICIKISDRLWVPHQAALEYQENRLGVISTQEDVFNQLLKVFQNAQDELETLLRRGHLSINVKRVIDKVEETFQSINQELNLHREQHPDLFNQDTIRDTITSIFDGKVGLPYSQARLNEIYKLGEKRYENKVPPGYKDRDKKGVNRYGSLVLEERYGDLILWFQVLDKAKEAKKPIVFVTDDTKEDWWWESRGKTVGPRPELLTEMKSEADVPFYIYTPNQFIDYAGIYLDIPVNQEIIEEVRDVTEATNWKEEVVNALEALGGQAHLSNIYEYIQRTTTRELPSSWQAIIRRTLQHYSSDSGIYRGKEDLFSRQGGGYWALRSMLSASASGSLTQESLFDITSVEEADGIIRSRLESGVPIERIVNELVERGVYSGWTRKRIKKVISQS
jgi:hypothetical protein